MEGGTATYYLADGLGSTTELADDAGAVTDGYRYDAFGALRSHVGTSANEWLFTGQQLDPTGLMYLRARYYDPQVGRFLTQDPFPGLISQPQSQNPYVYVSNNCVNLADPIGLLGFGPGTPPAKQVCVSSLEVWDLAGRVDIPLPFGFGHIETPALKLFRFELHVLYYRYGGSVYTHYAWASETYLSTGWHIDRSSLQFGPKEGGGAMASARFAAGGFNPFGFWPAGFNTDVQLRQRIEDGEIVGSESAQQNPFQFPGITAKSNTECGGWH